MTTSIPAIVLGMHSTGLRTAWCLADHGIEVYAPSFSPDEPGRLSRQIEVLPQFDLNYGDDRVVDWLLNFARTLPDRPVVFPISDQHALALSRNRNKLESVCRFSSTSFDTMKKIVQKDGLYRLARESDVPIPPSIVEPSIGELEDWCRANKGPYFLKPYYEGIQNSALKSKNQVIESREALISFVKRHGAKAIVVQRMISGGDGRIFDCYGYCDIKGEVVTMASHRRIRQSPVNTGTTCYGEIPATGIGNREEQIFDLTLKLLNGLGYHGIFGIEWLLDRETGDFYILDFNARPFLTINHLADCGLNLPYLAYRELLGEDVSDTPLRPQLHHKTWMDLNRDFSSFSEPIREPKNSRLQWIAELLACRSHAFWRARDPLPGFSQLGKFVARAFRKVFRVLMSSVGGKST